MKSRNMCVNCPDTGHLGCLGCKRYQCKCEKNCFRCWEYQNISSGCLISREPNSLVDFRIRFLCLKCNSCWKAKYDKYTMYLADYFYYGRKDYFSAIPQNIIDEIKMIINPNSFRFKQEMWTNSNNNWRKI